MVFPLLPVITMPSPLNPLMTSRRTVVLPEPIARIAGKELKLRMPGSHDVVPPGELSLWNTPPFEPTIIDGRIYGRGTLDDKGSFACAYSACKAFIAEHPRFDGTIYLIAAADEEVGSHLGIIYLVEECGLKFDVAIIPDGGRMDLSIYGEKGILWLDILSTGIQAHGSTPELGRNAIVPLAELISEIRTIDLGQKYDPAFDGWTMNIGTIQGGSATNTVPASARATIDFRLPAGITSEDVLFKVNEKIESVRRRSPAIPAIIAPRVVRFAAVRSDRPRRAPAPAPARCAPAAHMMLPSSPSPPPSPFPPPSPSPSSLSSSLPFVSSLSSSVGGKKIGRS